MAPDRTDGWLELVTGCSVRVATAAATHPLVGCVCVCFILFILFVLFVFCCAISMRRQPTDADVQTILANLKLPHMPTPTPTTTAAATTAAASLFQNNTNNNDHTHDPSSSSSASSSSSSNYPSLRILVVADIDLASASALAEYTLQQKNQVFDARDIDLCIACGSFCRDDDLSPYLRGKQQRRARERRQKRRQREYTDDEQSEPPPPATTMTTTTTTTTMQPNNNNDYYFNNNNQEDETRTTTTTTTTTNNGHEELFWRSREETSALEGLMTAALSQLESIVCRVVYCPGASDPLTTLLHHRGGTDTGTTTTAATSALDDHPTDSRAPRPKRLTPNSRNIHQQWLPLAPGIGCAALLYLDNQHIPSTAGQSNSSNTNNNNNSTTTTSPRRGTTPPRLSSSLGNTRSPSASSLLDHDGTVGPSSPTDDASDHEDNHDANDIKLLTEQLLQLKK